MMDSVNMFLWILVISTFLSVWMVKTKTVRICVSSTHSISKVPSYVLNKPKATQEPQQVQGSYNRRVYDAFDVPTTTERPKNRRVYDGSIQQIRSAISRLQPDYVQRNRLRAAQRVATTTPSPATPRLGGGIALEPWFRQQPQPTQQSQYSNNYNRQTDTQIQQELYAGSYQQPTREPANGAWQESRMYRQRPTSNQQTSDPIQGILNELGLNQNVQAIYAYDNNLGHDTTVSQPRKTVQQQPTRKRYKVLPNGSIVDYGETRSNNRPVEQSAPVQPVQPVQSVPIQPAQYVQPAQPVQPAQYVQPGQYVQQAQPIQQVQPVQPTNIPQRATTGRLAVSTTRRADPRTTARQIANTVNTDPVAGGIAISQNEIITDPTSRGFAVDNFGTSSTSGDLLSSALPQIRTTAQAAVAQGTTGMGYPDDGSPAPRYRSGQYNVDDAGNWSPQNAGATDDRRKGGEYNFDSGSYNRTRVSRRKNLRRITKKPVVAPTTKPAPPTTTTTTRVTTTTIPTTTTPKPKPKPKKKESIWGFTGGEAVNITYLQDNHVCPRSRARWQDYTVYLETKPRLCMIQISWNARYKQEPIYHRSWWGHDVEWVYKTVYDPEVKFVDLYSWRG